MTSILTGYLQTRLALSDMFLWIAFSLTWLITSKTTQKITKS